MSIRVTTTDFYLYNKLVSLNINNHIAIINDTNTRRRIKKIINNINYNKKNISVKITNKKIYLIKTTDFRLLTYYRHI